MDFSFLTATQIPLYGLLGVFLIRTLRNLLYHLFVWQRRDYRFDRMIAHVLTSSGQRWMFGNLALVKWILLFVTVIVQPLWNTYLPLLAVYSVETLLIFREWLMTGFKIPKPTLKTVVIFLVTLLLLSSLFLLRLPLPISLLLADKELPVAVFLLMLLFKIPYETRKFVVLKSAQKKLQMMSKLIRIGITGSYGKSTTKEFLAALLAKKYVVVKSEANFNTDIGLARTINKKITSNTQVFIAEMGAYTKGEIKKACEMVKPEIGIVTGINEQHIELFGSLANTRAAKYELIDSLPKHGFAVFNGDNEYTRLMAKKTKHVPVALYGKQKSTLTLNNIEETRTGLNFTLKSAQGTVRCKTSLYGQQYAYNIAAAVLVALHLKVSLKQIEQALTDLPVPPHLLQKAGEFQGATIVDDTANANPDGVKAGMNILRHFRGKKYIVMTPLIELGSHAEQIHQDITRFAIERADVLILTNKSYFSVMQKIAQKHGKVGFVQVMSPKKTFQHLQSIVTKDDVVILLGREAQHVLKAFFPNKAI